MNLNKKLITLLFIIILASCNDLEGLCYNENDYGDNGDFDNIVVSSESNLCNFDTSEGMEGSEQSLVMISCLEKQSVSACLNSDSIKEYVDKLSGEGKNVLCSEISKGSYKNEYFVNNGSGISDLDKKNIMTSIFNECVSKCALSCESENVSDEGVWTSANLKTDDAYIGITIGKKTMLNITAAGSIQLTNELSSPLISFKNYGMEEIGTGNTLNSGDTAEMIFKIRRTFGISGYFNNDINDFKGRTYLGLKTYNSNLSYAGAGFSKHKFQKPDFRAVACDYGDNYINCSFKHANIVQNYNGNANISNFISVLDKYYNTNYDTSIFNGKEFDTFANNVFNDVSYTANGNVAIFGKRVSKGSKDLSKTTEIIYKDIDQTEGYVWNDKNSSFSFSVNGYPFKLAIKHLNGNDDLKCKYSIRYNDYYLGKTSSGVNVAHSKDETTVLKTTYTKDKNSAFVWQTIKINKDYNENSNIENIFNRFSTVSRPQKMIVTIKNETESSGKIDKGLCSRGLAIKIIPLKDYLIKKTGYAFLSIPGATGDINRKLKYKLINPDVLYLTNSKLTLTNKLEDFFEADVIGYNNATDNPHSMEYKEVNLLNGSDFTTDYNSSDYYDMSDLISEDKVLYVREGQILRLDYRNWMIIDGEKDIKFTDKLTVNRGSIDNGTMEKLFGASLNIFIEENPFYICLGKADETTPMKNVCADEGGNYSEVTYKEENSTKNKAMCFVEEKECSIAADSDFYLKFNFMNADDGCKLPSEEIIKKAKDQFTDTTINLTNFIADLNKKYNKYFDDSSNGNNDGVSSTRHECYYPMIAETYKKALECYDKLSSGYNIVKGVVSGDGSTETHKEILKNISYINTNEINVEGITIIDQDGTLNSGVINSNGEIKNNTSIKNKKSVYDTILNRLNDLFFISKVGSEKVVRIDNKDEVIKSASYIGHFYYYKNVCKETASGNCPIENIPQCYNLSNYKGSVKNLLNRVKNNNTTEENEILNYGRLTDIDKAFGARKLFEYNGNYGLIKNFETIKENDSGFYTCKYSENIRSNGMNFFSTYIIKEFNTNGLNYGTNFKDFITPIKNSDSIIEIATTVKNSFLNGNRLAVILGENEDIYSNNKKTYYSNNAFGEKNLIYYMNEGSKKTTINNKDIVELVSYDRDGNFSDQSLFKFNENGVLVSNINGVPGIDFGNEDNYKLQNYLDINGSAKNLFFKIIDIDDTSSNNSGSYSVTINAYSNEENKIITYFREFFNEILSFVDGKYFELKFNDNRLHLCDKNDDAKCFIYNEENVKNNGESCNKSYNNDKEDKNEKKDCYLNCIDNGKDDVCKTFYDGKGFVKNIFMSFITDPLYQLIAKISLVLAITLYGFCYFFGLSNFTQSEILNRIIRYSFIYFLISPSGWEFFDEYIIRFFKDGIDSLLFLIASAFDTDVDSSLFKMIAIGSYGDKSAIFNSTFNNLKLIFSEPVFNKILGLAFSGWFGLIYLYLVLSAVINYIVGALTAIILYLSAQLYMSLVFALFPLVILFMFFEKTKKTFDNWINMLIGFAGQQIFLITTLSLFNLLILTYIRTTFSYSVCLESIFNLNIASFTLTSIIFWKIPSSSFSNSINVMNENLPNFYSIISFYIISVLMGKFITGMVEVGRTIFGGMGIGGGIAGSFIGGVNKAGGAAKNLMKTTGTTFAKGMADRFLGGRAIKEFSEKQQKERENRKKTREEFFNKNQEDVRKGMDDYKNSQQFAKDVEKRREEIKNSDEYKNASERKKNKMLNNAEKDVLQKKQKDLTINKGINNIKSQYEDKLREISERNGINYDKLDEEEQNDIAYNYGVDRGLIPKGERLKVEPLKKPVPTGDGGGNKPNPPKPPVNGGSGDKPNPPNGTPEPGINPPARNTNQPDPTPTPREASVNQPPAGDGNGEGNDGNLII